MPERLCPLKEAAKDAPRSIGFQTQTNALTFSQLDAITDQAVCELQAMGLQKYDRLGVLLPSGLYFYTLLFASLRIGAIFCPLNLRLPPASLDSHLACFSPKILISSSGYEVKSANRSDLPSSSLLIFTSGSTGAPKLAVLSLAAMLASASSAIDCCDLREGDGWLLSLPLHHVGGLAILFRCLLARATIIDDPSNIKISHLSYVPAQLYRSWPVYPRLRCLLLGGGPIQDIPSELPISVSYAMTETASLVLARQKPRLKNGLLHLGFPVAGKEIKLSSEGEIFVRGDSLFSGYWEQEKLQMPFDAEGWFATKDLGSFDPEEGFAITGRKDNQFISGGENIQPEEIEQELSRYPGIIDVVVVPIEDPRFGNRPVAYIRLLDGTLNKADVQHFLAKRLPKYKIPDAFFSLEELGEIDAKTRRKKIFELANKKK